MKEFESFGLDTGNECLWRNGAQLSLPPKPFAVLRYLVENPGRLITHDELLDALWPETYVQPQVLRTYMLELRKVLGDDAGNPRFIQTLPKRGYCFVAAVTDGTDALKRTVANGIRAQAETRSGNGVAATASHEPENGMVGREDEIARLRTGLKDAAKGQRQVFFVSGEVGIGKSALVDAFARIAGTFQAGDGVLVARGQCVEGFGGKEEYYPVVEVLSQLCGLPDGERACRILSTIAPTWMASHRKDSAAGAVVLERMPGDICAALEALAAEKPLILIFEDLHWADDATLHLISALARRRGEAQLMLVLTCRPQDGTALKGLRQDLRMKRLCAEVALSPLRKADVKELLRREMKQEDLPQGLASFVHQHSEGNPLFAIALLEHLIAQGFLVKARGEDRVWEQRAPFQEMEAGVPDGLAQMIELEIERLSPE